MITQYSWASVKNQQRKHIEIGMMVSLGLAIITFYAVPDFGINAPVVEEYVPPLIEVFKIPATTQPPERVEPVKPSLPVESPEAPEMDDPLKWSLEYKGVDVGFLEPPEPALPDIPFWAVEVKPAPIGGYPAILNNVVYPEVAKAAGVEGRVSVEALIWIDGSVKDVKIIKGVPRTGLDDAAVEAIYRTKFTPAYQRDKPVPVWMSISILFTLK